MEWYWYLLLSLYYLFLIYHFYKIGTKNGYHRGWKENAQATNWNEKVYEERENKLKDELDFERERSEHWIKLWQFKNEKLGKALDKNTKLEEELRELKKSREIHPCGSIKKSNISDDTIWNFDLNWVEYHDVLVKWISEGKLDGKVFEDVEFIDGVGKLEFNLPNCIENYISYNLQYIDGYSVLVETKLYRCHINFKLTLTKR